MVFSFSTKLPRSWKPLSVQGVKSILSLSWFAKEENWLLMMETILFTLRFYVTLEHLWYFLDSLYQEADSCKGFLSPFLLNFPPKWFEQIWLYKSWKTISFRWSHENFEQDEEYSLLNCEVQRKLYDTNLRYFLGQKDRWCQVSLFSPLAYSSFNTVITFLWLVSFFFVAFWHGHALIVCITPYVYTWRIDTKFLATVEHLHTLVSWYCML